MSRIIASVALAAMLLIAGMTGAVAAQEEEDSLFEQLTGVDTDDAATLGERIDAANAAIAGYSGRATYAVSTAQSKVLDGKTDADLATQYAEDTRQTFNEHNSTIESYVNQRVNVNVSEWDVIAVEHVAGDESATIYVVSTNNGSNFDNAQAVNTTNRTVDHTLVLEDNAAESADDELAYFGENYAAEDKDIDRALITRMQAYADQITLPEEVQN